MSVCPPRKLTVVHGNKNKKKRIKLDEVLAGKVKKKKIIIIIPDKGVAMVVVLVITRITTAIQVKQLRTK